MWIGQRLSKPPLFFNPVMSKIRTMLFKMLISFLPSIIDFLKGGKLKKHAAKIFTEEIHNTINDFVVAYNVAYDNFIDENEEAQ